MEKETSYKGDWWLPNTPNRRIRGEVVYVPGEGMTLTLEGSLIEEPIRGRQEFINPEIVLGYSTTGKEITLRSCLQTQSVGAFEIKQTTFYASMMFVGCHFLSDELVKLHGVTVQFANLNYWIYKKGISSEFQAGVFLARYEQPADTKVRIGNLDIKFSLRSDISHDLESLHITEKGLTTTWSDIDLHVDEHLKFLKLIQDFLSFAMLKPTIPLHVTGLTDLSLEEDNEDGKKVFVPIEIYYPIATRVGKPTKVHPNDMLFILDSVEPQLQSLLQKWIERSELLQPVYNLYFSVLYSPETYAELKFLTLTQCIETYHSRVFGGKYQSDAEYLDGLYKALLVAIPDDISSDFKESLKRGKLRYANEYSLRKRLELLVDHVADLVPLKFLQEANLQRKFAAKVSDTRNYLTHYSIEMEESLARTGKGYSELTGKLRTIIEILLLEELGFDPETLRKFVMRNRRYSPYL